MEYKPKVFGNRHEYWRERQGLGRKGKESKTMGENDSGRETCAEELSSDDMNKAFKNIRSCPHCGNTNRDLFQHVDVDIKTKNHLAYTECMSCNRLIGADDTMSHDTVQAWIKSMKVVICKCEDGDVDEYVLKEHDGKMFFFCRKCKTEVPVKSSEEKGDNSPQKDDSLNLECQKCGNKDGDKIEVYMTNDTVHALQCLCCNEISYIQTEDDFPEMPDPGNEGNQHMGDYLDIKCKSCHNTYPDVFEPYGTNETGITMKCLACDEFNLIQIKDENPRVSNSARSTYVSPEDAKRARIVGRSAIKVANQLSTGDHIAWWRPEQYWHHALVKECHNGTNSITVIHYNGPSPGGMKVKGKIVEEKLDLEQQSGILYKMIYSGICFPAYQAIERATTRLGECTYNFFTNNCEHFVRWCKTDQEICEQVSSALKFAKDHYKKMQGIFSRKPMEKALDVIARQAVGEIGFPIGNIQAAGAMAIVGFEIAKLVDDVNVARNQRAQGHISRPEFINVVVCNTFQATLRGTGTIAGTILGNMVIPLAGGVVGSTLGAMLGNYIGSVVGYQFAKHINTCDQ